MTIKLQPMTKKEYDDRFNIQSASGAIECDHIKTSTELLNECVSVQSERGAEYDENATQERSFSKIATAFSAITGKNLTPAEVCLVLQITKDVRQWGQDRLHEDSVLDGISYASLKGEELYRQYNNK